MDELINTFAQRGDLAHLALFLWASAASALLVFVTREFAAATRRFDDFVRELSRFNDRFKANDRFKGKKVMDNLHTVLRSIRGETKARRDHLTVFREFLSYLDRITKSRSKAARSGRVGKNLSSSGRRSKKS